MTSAKVLLGVPGNLLWGLLKWIFLPLKFGCDLNSRFDVYLAPLVTKYSPMDHFFGVLDPSRLDDIVAVKFVQLIEFHRRKGYHLDADT